MTHPNGYGDCASEYVGLEQRRKALSPWAYRKEVNHSSIEQEDPLIADHGYYFLQKERDNIRRIFLLLCGLLQYKMPKLTICP